MVSGTFRGGIQHASTVMYGAWEGEVYTVNQSGERALFSTLSGTDDIFAARNNRSPNADVAVVTNNGAFIINTTAAAVQSYPDGDVGSPTCVGGHLGYLMFGYGDGDLQSSDLNSTNINTLNSARTESNPDGVLNIKSFDGQMYAMGKAGIEVWGDPVNASGFPLTRVGYNIRPGLASAHATAGWEPEFGYGPVYVGSDDSVRQLRGYQAVKISPPDLDRLIAKEVIKTAIACVAYVSAGQAFVEVTGTNWTWVYNVNSDTWHERKKHNGTRSSFTNYVAAFGKWLVGDRDGTDLLSISHNEQDEAGDPLICQMESGETKDFPNRIRCRRADFDFTVGVGETGGLDPIEVDPHVLIEWSDDGGRTWSVPWWRKLGKQAESFTRVFLINTGLTGPRGRKWRWTVSDKVHVGFLGSTMEPEVREK